MLVSECFKKKKQYWAKQSNHEFFKLLKLAWVVWVAGVCGIHVTYEYFNRLTTIYTKT